MKKTSRLLSAVIALTLIFAIASPAFAAGETLTAQEASAQEALEAQAENLLTCPNGEFPEDLTLDFCDAVMEYHPELAEKLFEHFEEVAFPIEEAPAIPESVYSLHAESGQRRDGSYVRQGDGGYFIYDDVLPIEEELSDLERASVFENPFPVSLLPAQYFITVAIPKNSSLTQSTCKVMCFKGQTWYHGSGFFVGNKVVATAAHCIYNSDWSADHSTGWADNVYIYQAYAPKQATKAQQQPFGRVYADTKNMRVGADWIGNYFPDADWGAFATVASMGSGTSYLKKKQVSVIHYVGKNIRTQGYPAPDTAGGKDIELTCSVTVGTDTLAPGTTRCLLSTSPNSRVPITVKEGMSGGPVMDYTTDEVIGIQSALVNESGGNGYARAVTFDSWLYSALKKYE